MTSNHVFEMLTPVQNKAYFPLEETIAVTPVPQATSTVDRRSVLSEEGDLHVDSDVPGSNQLITAVEELHGIVDSAKKLSPPKSEGPSSLGLLDTSFSDFSVADDDGKEILDDLTRRSFSLSSGLKEGGSSQQSDMDVDLRLRLQRALAQSLLDRSRDLSDIQECSVESRAWHESMEENGNSLSDTKSDDWSHRITNMMNALLIERSPEYKDSDVSAEFCELVRRSGNSVEQVVPENEEYSERHSMQSTSTKIVTQNPFSGSDVGANEDLQSVFQEYASEEFISADEVIDKLKADEVEWRREFADLSARSFQGQKVDLSCFSGIIGDAEISLGSSVLDAVGLSKRKIKPEEFFALKTDNVGSLHGEHLSDAERPNFGSNIKSPASGRRRLQLVDESASKVLLLYFVPAFMYCLYNNLAFVNLSAFDPTTYYLLLQFRVVVTGVVFQVIFKKKLSTQQWLSLIMLTAGCMIKQIDVASLGVDKSSNSVSTTSSSVGFHFTINALLILVQTVCSCIAGVYNEYLLKGEGADVNIFVQNVFMYVDSIACNAGILFFQGNLIGAFSANALASVFTFKAAFYAEYESINSTGQSLIRGALLLAELVSCGKRMLARMLVIIVSLGFGIVKPRLGSMLYRVVFIGILYFVVAAGESYLRVMHPKNASNQILVASIPLAVLDPAICWWIFTSLVKTTRTLGVHRNLVKLSLYRHFTYTLIFSVVSSVVFMLYSICYHHFNPCFMFQDWKELWVDDAYWHLLFSILLILWRPTNNKQRLYISVCCNTTIFIVCTVTCATLAFTIAAGRNLKRLTFTATK